ncbi:MAG: DUF2520 domain-containing protein [Chitinophagaceae bacterium]
MRIVIIGTGNTATVMGRLLKKAQLEIVQVFGNNITRAEVLAKELASLPCSTWDAINKEADLYLVAITDTAIYELGRHLSLGNQVVLHTAGSVQMEVLKGISNHYGVLYPLQSLRKEMAVLTHVPLLVNASDDETLKIVLRVAQQISSQVSVVNDEMRLKLHLAAVCMNNFCNHLYEIAEDFCSKENVDFKLLLPLAVETARRIELVSPSQVITGPAIRNDQLTISRHLQILQSYPSFYKVYEELTNSIRIFHSL